MNRVRKNPPAAPAGDGYVNIYSRGSSLILVCADGKLKRLTAEWVCYVKAADLNRDTLTELRGSNAVLSMRAEGEWMRIQWAYREACLKGCKWLETVRGVQTYEGGVTPVQRYMADNPTTRVLKPRRAYFDIETDSRVPFSRKTEARILCFTLVNEQGRSRTCVLEDDTDASERKLLQQLVTLLAEKDQLIAWAGAFRGHTTFDFEMITARSEKLGLNVNWRRWLMLDHLMLFQRWNMQGAESGEEKQSMKLQDIATAVLGEGKDDFDASKTWEAWSNATPCADGKCRACRACLKKYNRQDTMLLYKLEAKTHFIEQHQVVCELCGVFADTHGVSPSSQVEGYLFRLGTTKGLHFPTNYVDDAREKFAGAFVMDPTWTGITKNVHVADFAALYPNIIVTWNMSHETKVKKPVEGGRPAYLGPAKPVERPPDVAESTIGIWFKQDVVGILAQAVSDLMRLRKHWKKLAASLPANTPEWQNAHRLDTAYKIMTNIFFGVVSSPMSKVFDPEIGESITQCGAWLIQETMAYMTRKHALEVGYGDTDSSMVRGCTVEAFKLVIDDCNKNLYPDLLAARGCKRNTILLDNDKTFERIIFVSKKRYCARILVSKGKAATDESAAEVKGLEYRRGDTSRITREMQKEAVDLLCQKRCEDLATFVTLVEQYRERVLLAELEGKDVIVSKRLSKPLKGYATKKKKDGTDSADLPHIRIAKEMAQRGLDVGEGTRIAYFCVDGAAKPKKYAAADAWDGKLFDRHELWEAVVYPPTQRLLESAFPGGGWERWLRTRPKGRRGRPIPEEQGRLFDDRCMMRVK